MLPDYKIYETTKDIESIKVKKGEQLIRVFPWIGSPLLFLPTLGVIADHNFYELERNGSLNLLGCKGNSLPISQVHPDILNFYKSQLAISNYYEIGELTELQKMLGRSYITDTLATAALTIHSMAEMLVPTPILPTIVGKFWFDFVDDLGNMNQLGIIPAIMAELAKVTLEEMDI